MNRHTTDTTDIATTISALARGAGLSRQATGVPSALGRGHGGVRTLRVALAAGLALAALCCTFAAPVAVAARAHGALSSFVLGGAGVVAGEAGSLSLASDGAGSGVAVNDASHDVYVADTGNRRVDEFDPAKPPVERFVRAWGWGVATGAAELQVCTATCRPGLAGSEPGEFQAPAYIAVDNGAASASKGAVYVGDPGDDLVTKFDAEGHLVGSWGNNGENVSHEHTEPNGQLNGSPTELFTSGFTVAQIPIDGVTVDGSGNLWAYNLHQRLFEFKQDGAWVLTSTAFLSGSPGAGGIAVSGSCEESCQLYVHDGNGKIQVFNQAFVNIGQLTSGSEHRQGVAVDGSDGDRYVVSEGGLVEDIPAACVPSGVGCSASQVFGEGSLDHASGLALDSGSGAVFVANVGADQVAVFGLVLEGDVGGASGVLAHEAVLHGAVNPLGVELSACRFEFGSTLSYGSSVPCAQGVGSIGKGSSPVAVDATLSGLSGGTAYHFRLHGRSVSGNVYSEDGTFTTATTALVREVSASEVADGSALLRAVVNPEGLPAHYRFEYGACPVAGQCVGSPFTASVPVPDGEIPAGSSDVTVSAPVGGLSAGVTYHFRVVVDDGNGEALPTPEGTFVSEPQASGCVSARPPADVLLADCRAYEMVTPPEKNGALIDNGAFIEDPSIAADGSRVLSMSIQCFDNAQSCTAVRQTEGTPFAFTRSEAGWRTEPLAPPITANNTALAYGADSDMVLFARSAVPPALEELVAREPDGTLKPIGPIAEAPGTQIGAITGQFRGATADLSHVVYQEGQGAGLWPSLEAGVEGDSVSQALEYPGDVSGRPALVGVSGGAGSTSLIGACGTSLGGNKLVSSEHGSLSSDGRATFFTVYPCKSGTGANAGVEVSANTLYQRVEGVAGAMKTVLVSGPGPASVCDVACQKAPPRAALFAGASTDGSRVFFTDTGQLTDSASDDRHSHDSAFTFGCTETSPVSSGCNLYEFACPSHCEDESERKLVDVSAGDTSGVGPQVQGVVAIPPDGSDVYFVAHGVLTSTANPMGREPVPGAANLYVYRFGAAGGEGQVKFVATLSAADHSEWADGVGIANVTSDGSVLVFTSHRALTPDVSREEGPAQVYRYDLDTERLSRVSIGRAGFGDDGNASVADAGIAKAFLGFESGVGPGRSDPTMSDDGRLVFFETPAGLTPGALNDHAVTGNPKALAENVYEWAAEGAQPSPDAPACMEPNGCVSLISDGRDLTEGTGAKENHSAVQLLGVDSSGGDVFFWTADPLVAQDTDSQVDLYDARIGGGFPEPSVLNPCATLEECRPATPFAVSLFSSPPSATFSGPGNPLSSPLSLPGSSVRSKPLTRAQLLARALRACRTIHSKHKRAACGARARKRYAPKHKPKPVTRRSSRGSRK